MPASAASVRSFWGRLGRAGLRRRAVAAGLGAAALLASACAKGSRDPDPVSDLLGRRIRIQVTNRNFSDATLWALSPRGRERLGIVPGKGRRTFALPWEFSQPLRIEIDLLAGGRCVTRSLQVDPGDVLELQIDVVLRRSAVCS